MDPSRFFDPKTDALVLAVIDLEMGLRTVADLNQERETLRQLVNELYHVLVLEA